MTLVSGDALSIKFSHDGVIENLVWKDGHGKPMVEIKGNDVEGGRFADAFLPKQFRSNVKSVSNGVFGFAVKPLSDGWIQILSVKPDTAAGRAGLSEGEIVKLKDFTIGPNITLTELHGLLINAREITLERKNGECVLLTQGD